AQRDAVAGRQDERAGPGPAPALLEGAVDLAGAGADTAGLEGDLDGAEEAVALLAGVLAGGVGQLALEALEDTGEGGVVIDAEVDDERVGDDGPAPDVDRAVGVELADHAAGDLDGADARLEGAGEGALDGLFQPALEALQAHGRERYRPCPSSP